ncbi:amidase [Aquamicrobium ahrensii]|uniref:Aspartyl-tRNA(Asn)/glutamyl-tRNA(Gln) amidotransferase subunit A n=1 Tax=Aquamicrobium ahrensii TaxID=469551 RepID=A0ABV2KPE7_9HYPH
MSLNELVHMTCREQGTLIESRKISPVDLVQASLDRIDRYDRKLNAWISVDPERALKQARQAEADICAGRYRGPLHGIPYGVKDQMHALGFPTTLGTKVLREDEMVPPHDSTVVRKLADAGSVLLGKQNQHEWGKGSTIEFPYGLPRNPWHPDYDASSSSTGSGIAPAAGQCSFSIGEDTGGSIRGPSSCNGIAGLRPTFGRISRHGGVMAGYTSDTFGPMARSVEDLALVLEAVAGHDPLDRLSSPRPVPRYSQGLDGDLRGMRLAVVREIAYGDIDAEVLETFENAVSVLRDAGATIEEISLPLARHAVALQMLTTDADVASWFLANFLKDRYELFDQGTRTRLVASSLIPATVYHRAMRARTIVREEVLDAMRRYDALLTPTDVFPPRLVDAARERISSREDVLPKLIRRRIAYYPFSLSNVPAMAIPSGFSSKGLPLSLQIASRPFGEPTVLKIGHAFQQHTQWHRQHPDMNRTLAHL